MAEGFGRWCSVADVNGDTYWNPTTGSFDSWQSLIFDLTPFKDLASFEVTIQNSAKTPEIEA